MNKIGLIAGAGELPVTFAREVSKLNHPITVFAVKNIADKSLERYAPVKWIHFGEAQKLIDLMKEENVKDVVMLGKIEHYSLIFSFHKLDKRAKQFFSSLKDKRAKSILEAVIKELEKEGFSFIDPSPYLSPLLVEEGLIGNLEPDEKALKDAKFGLSIAKEIAQLDIGQTVVVKDGIVIAVEGIEGTDRCIIRGGELGGEGTVVCKVARKNQDMRYDVPVIGPKTLKSMKKAKSKMLAVEAGKTFLLEREKFIKMADKYGIAVYGFKL
jgi:DUF1009 family protein